MKTHKITIRPIGEGQYYVQVDDKEMLSRSINLHMDRDSVPEVDIELIGEPNVDVEGLVQFDYTPKTIVHAADVIRAGLKRNDITAFLAMNTLNKVLEEIGNGK